MLESYARYEAIRDSKHYKDATVAKFTGIARATISDWKKGTYEPKIDKITKIAEFLECKVSDILDADYIPKIPAPDISAECIELVSLYGKLNAQEQKILLDMARNMVERADIISKYAGTN